jgi:hypothetical protein
VFSLNIHLIIPFSRPENKDKLIEDYRPMGVILHPIMFGDENIDFDEPWTYQYIIPEATTDCDAMMPGSYKRNHWIQNHTIIDDDYYVTVDDDDMYEPNVFDEIRKMDSDIVIISMKRGHQTPVGVAEKRAYPTSTLVADPENMKMGFVSAQQLFVKGHLFKSHLHNENLHAWDGELAEHYVESGEQITYLPDLFALFNYYEPTRWDKVPKMTFACMINDPVRFDMVLKQSQLPGRLMFVQNPESATKGLNILLDKAEAENADVCVLTHQDMYFRSGWVEQVWSQIKLLPDSWVVAGVIGKDAEGLTCGKFHDMRIPDYFNTSDVHSFPQPACCFDECVIIVNMKKKFRFDELLAGFDLYGTLCVLQTWEMGGTAWVIDAFCEHYCLRPFTWFPDESFRTNYKLLHDRFSEKWKLDSTALGMSLCAEEKLKQIKAFMTSAAPEEKVV